MTIAYKRARMGIGNFSRLYQIGYLMTLLLVLPRIGSRVLSLSGSTFGDSSNDSWSHSLPRIGSSDSTNDSWSHSLPLGGSGSTTPPTGDLLKCDTTESGAHIIHDSWSHSLPRIGSSDSTNDSWSHSLPLGGSGSTTPPTGDLLKCDTTEPGAHIIHDSWSHSLPRIGSSASTNDSRSHSLPRIGSTKQSFMTKPNQSSSGLIPILRVIRVVDTEATVGERTSSLSIYDENDDHSTDTTRYDSTMATEGKKLPYSYKRALAIDKETGTTSWHLSMKKELDDIDSYSTFENMGRISDGARAPKDHQRWNALFYHRVREAIAAKYVVFLHLNGKKNPNDICTKLLKHIDMKDFVVPLMSFKSDVGVQHPTGAIQQMTHRVILHYYPSVGVVGVQGPNWVIYFTGANPGRIPYYPAVGVQRPTGAIQQMTHRVIHQGKPAGFVITFPVMMKELRDSAAAAYDQHATTNGIPRFDQALLEKFREKFHKDFGLITSQGRLYDKFDLCNDDYLKLSDSQRTAARIGDALQGQCPSISTR
jgi:hypothetical protein